MKVGGDESFAVCQLIKFKTIIKDDRISKEWKGRKEKVKGRNSNKYLAQPQWPRPISAAIASYLCAPLWNVLNSIFGAMQASGNGGRHQRESPNASQYWLVSEQCHFVHSINGLNTVRVVVVRTPVNQPRKGFLSSNSQMFLYPVKHTTIHTFAVRNVSWSSHEKVSNN